MILTIRVFRVRLNTPNTATLTVSNSVLGYFLFNDYRLFVRLCGGRFFIVCDYFADFFISSVARNFSSSRAIKNISSASSISFDISKVNKNNAFNCAVFFRLCSFVILSHLSFFLCSWCAVFGIKMC